MTYAACSAQPQESHLFFLLPLTDLTFSQVTKRVTDMKVKDLLKIKAVMETQLLNELKGQICPYITNRSKIQLVKLQIKVWVIHFMKLRMMVLLTGLIICLP